MTITQERNVIDEGFGPYTSEHEAEKELRDCGFTKMTKTDFFKTGPDRKQLIGRVLPLGKLSENKKFAA